MIVVNFGTSSEQKEKFESEATVKRQLAEIRDNLESEVKAELDSVMQKIKLAAIELCPKDTGALASSISLDEHGAIQSGDFYGCSIFAGSDDIINPKTGKPTSEYALFVHDGHAMRDGTFWEGIPFLDEAMLMYFDELEAAVDRALKSLGQGMETD